jgi:mRNA interferase MazF
MSRGDVYLADLNPSRGSEQDGRRPVIIVQRESLNRFTRTTMVVPLTTNLRRTQVPGTILNSFLECPPLSAFVPPYPLLANS